MLISISEYESGRRKAQSADLVHIGDLLLETKWSD
jgi:hypothetical protein